MIIHLGTYLSVDRMWCARSLRNGTWSTRGRQDTATFSQDGVLMSGGKILVLPRERSVSTNLRRNYESHPENRPPDRGRTAAGIHRRRRAPLRHYRARAWRACRTAFRHPYTRVPRRDLRPRNRRGGCLPLPPETP